jgi:capsular polysaccharide biosynthesis protein
MKQNTYDSLQVQEDDTIDLRELFHVLKKRQKLIYLLTLLITLSTIAYVYTVKSVYEVKVSMELGQINKKPVQSIMDLKQKIETMYEIDNKEIELPKVTNITLPKNTNNIIKMNAQGYTNIGAKEKLQHTITYIKSLQDKDLNSYVSLQEKKLQLTKEDIKNNIQTIAKISEDIKNYEHKLLNISKQDAALAGIYAIAIGKKETELNNISSRINSLKNQKNTLEFSISPLNIKRASVIGKMVIHDKPIKPKKILIIIVSFITALMLSIFLAFFLEFIQGLKDEDIKES